MAGAGILDSELQKLVDSSKILVVGAGGIGCELLKNLVLTGFKEIEVIDLDTIDVSNLNRQFLFHKQHVGKSKAKVAKESALQFNPDANITAHHDSIMNPKYNISYFQQFNVVLNALDNRAARNHVNRLCLAAEVPLIESGTAGFDGQVELIVKGKTKCYECDPKAPQKTFPGCTIRNTPSDPIHCIVWAKHLFNQLFGEEDPDQDVSPDTADPEAAGEAGEGALKAKATEEGNVERVSTRAWAQSCQYDPEKLFTKLFNDDIKYLLSMGNLWKTRLAPTPLDWNNLPDGVQGSSREPENVLRDQRCWSVAECGKVFADSCKELAQQFKALKEGDHLVWDKDDKAAMDFVAACANIRAHIFGIANKSRFDVKSMAGNIIPAIATTNAIVAGMVVLHALKVLQGQLDQCQSVYLRLRPNPRGQIIVPERQLQAPNPKCYVCSSKPTVALSVDVQKMTVKELEEAVLKKALNMVAPDARLDDGSGSIIISSEEGETEHNNNKTLTEVGIRDSTVMIVDDFQQNYELAVVITHKEEFSEGQTFELIAGEDAKPKEAEDAPKNGDSKEESDDDDMMILGEDEEVCEVEPTSSANKRKLPEAAVPAKKRRHNSDEITCLDDTDEPITV
ncbi:SUMO-activating enzyme subunit 2-like [Macrosteles quadrilineatus]|uniref:SUMO-activating enzyme subunit 2-like n=1 Tax=Macrosteles quadrilineatus TaxID=74068 RepID=UPI0023E33B62|nr:SUMO-activating enzyme subunit 2-like [Macrosteles quadrilineatus]XP_054288508.1 SUMO-activating enzyme subunit 2-like [Macrosteles quadrilineatus]